MNKWLAELHRLQALDDPSLPLNLKTRNPHLPSKPSELSFEGFEESEGLGVLEFTPLAAMRMAHDLLRDHCPDLIEESRWQQAVMDGEVFLSVWGGPAAALGWTETDLFGLHQVPKKPSPRYRRLARYDQAGLIWLLQGRIVLAITERSAAIHNPAGSITTYRKPATTQVAPAH